MSITLKDLQLAYIGTCWNYNSNGPGPYIFIKISENKIVYRTFISTYKGEYDLQYVASNWAYAFKPFDKKNCTNYSDKKFYEFLDSYGLFNSGIKRHSLIITCHEKKSNTNI